MFKFGIMVLGLIGSTALAVPAMANQHGASAPAVPGGATEQGGAPSTPRTERERRAAEILRQMLPRAIADGMVSKQPTSRFGGEMARLAVENSYEQLWTRPGLSLKDRSMITIAMLIGMGNDRELKVHIQSGLRNGVTRSELEEIIYHATAYAGFPRASDAMRVATEVMGEKPGAMP